MDFARHKCSMRTPTSRVVDVDCTPGKSTLIPRPVTTFSDVKSDDYKNFLKADAVGRVIFTNAVNAIRAQVLAEEAGISPTSESWMTSIWIEIDGTNPHFPVPEGFWATRLGPHEILVSALMENVNRGEWKITISFRAFKPTQGGRRPVGYYLDTPFHQQKAKVVGTLQLGDVAR